LQEDNQLIRISETLSVPRFLCFLHAPQASNTDNQLVLFIPEHYFGTVYNIKLVHPLNNQEWIYTIVLQQS